MTCVIAIKMPGQILFGADSLYTRTLTQYHFTGPPKIFKNGTMLLGGTGSTRINQLLQYSLKIPEQKNKNTMKYLCNDFTQAVRRCLHAGGIKNVNNEVESMSGIILIAYKRNIYTMWGDFQIATTHNPYQAIGSGEEFALGALYALWGKKGLTPRQIAKRALGAAAKFSPSVSAPFQFMKLINGGE